MLTTPAADTTELDTGLLQSTYRFIKEQPEEFATSFYDILFAKYPKIQPLFIKTDMKKQKDKLIESIDLVLVNVHNPSAFTTVLKELGKRHVKYGAVLTDYPLIGDALLQALEKQLGEHWNPAVKQSWALAYQLIADTMAEGAKTAIEKEPSPQISLDRNQELDPPKNPEANATNSSTNGLAIALCIVAMVALGYMGWNMVRSQSNDSNPAGVSNPVR